MDALLGNPNIVGYVLLVALAGVLILRYQASRRRMEQRRQRRRDRIASLMNEGETEKDELDDDEPAKEKSFDRARLQFYIVILAVIALIAAYVAQLF